MRNVRSQAHTCYRCTLGIAPPPASVTPARQMRTTRIATFVRVMITKTQGV